jgi:hypothetical protein
MINEYGAVGGLRIGWEYQSTRKKNGYKKDSAIGIKLNRF